MSRVVTTLVTFQIDCPTLISQNVKIVGSTTSLGNWNLDEGVSMFTSPETYPLWRSNPIIVPLRKKLFYKYFISNESGGFLSWEDFAGNRELVPNGPAMIVEDDEGKCRLMSTSNDPTISGDLAVPIRGTSGSKMMHHHPSPLLNAISLQQETSDLIDNLKKEDLGGKSLVVLSFELPIKVVRDDGYLSIQKQKSFVMPQLHSLRVQLGMNVQFIGYPGISVESEEERLMVEELLTSHDCVPVYIDALRFKKYVEFCHQILLPLFHNVVVADSQVPFCSDSWSNYQFVNKLYSDTVTHIYHESHLVWVHDYHLLLTPYYLTRKIRKANVGLFLHVPFPSSEIFRCLPVREDILRSMLCADLLGFHFFEYARHFLVSTKRLLGLEHSFRLGGFLEIEYMGRSIGIKIGHVHIQYDELRILLENSDDIENLAQSFKCRVGEKVVFAALDRCDRLSGLLLKLRGFQSFIKNYPYAKGNVILIQLAYPSFTASDEQYSNEVISLVQEINDFCPNSVWLQIKSVSQEEKYALFKVANCLIDTSVRDGLNLNAFEFICVNENRPHPLIISEFSGCSYAISSAIRVNPFKVESLVEAMDRAMTSSGTDVTIRFQRDTTYLSKNSTLQWAKEFLVDLKRSKKKEEHMYLTWGFGNNLRLCSFEAGFEHLDIDETIQCFKSAKRPILFFDHEGTLAPDRRHLSTVPGMETLTACGSKPGLNVLACLTELCNAGIPVVILSGRDRFLLDEWFGDVPSLGLCAEHGFYYKEPLLPISESFNNWHCLLSSAPNLSWKGIAHELMGQYVKRTQGAFIENKGSALVFQYRGADPDFGSWQAKELSNHLEEILHGCPVNLMSGKGYVEVKTQGVNKGAAISKLLSKLRQRTGLGNFDFVIAIGDDRSDEEMYPIVDALFPRVAATTRAESFDGSSSTPHKKHDDFECQPFGKGHFKGFNRQRSSQHNLPTAFSVTVGKKPSLAHNYLNDVDEVTELLVLMASQVARQGGGVALNKSGDGRPHLNKQSTEPLLS